MTSRGRWVPFLRLGGDKPRSLSLTTSILLGSAIAGRKDSNIRVFWGDGVEEGREEDDDDDGIGFGTPYYLSCA